MDATNNIIFLKFPNSLLKEERKEKNIFWFLEKSKSHQQVSADAM